MDGIRKLWAELELVAFDLEGTGAQDREDEAILELAAVPIHSGQPLMHAAYCTLINPDRPVPRRPWISPGLTDDALREAPLLHEVEPHISSKLNGRYIVGHNVLVDWRLLHRRFPDIEPAGLIDTMKLLRHHGADRRGLSAALQRFGLTDRVTQAAPDSQPHRALWDATGAALLLRHLAETSALSADDLLSIAGIPANGAVEQVSAQGTLF